MALPPLTAAEAMCTHAGIDLAKARRRLNLQDAKGWVARKDRQPWPFALPFDWSADPFEDPNWQFQLNCWRPLDVYINVHFKGADAVAFQRVVDAMLDWRRHEAAGGFKRVLWGDMSTGMRASKLAYVLTQPDFTRLTAREQTELTQMARDHLARLRDPDFISTSNHALAQIHGAMALIRVGPDWPEAKDGEAYVAGLLSASLASQFGAEGMHLEHSPSYHVFAINAFRRMRDTGWHANPDLNRLLDLAEAAVPWLVHPDGRMAAMGDSATDPRPVSPPQVRSRVVGQLFQEAGYAVVRRNWEYAAARSAMLLVTCGYHSDIHKHADDLSFELFEGGRRLFVDTGKYSYSPGPLRNYGKSARAHNTIDMVAERDDNGLSLSPPSGGGLTRLDRTDWGWIIDGAFERPAVDVAHRRRFLYRPRQWLVLLDEVTSNRKRAMTAWLHLDPDLRARRQGQGWDIDRVAISYVADHRLDLEQVRGREAPLQGWMAASYHHRVENDALAARWTGKGGRLATLIRLAPDAPTPQVRIVKGAFEVVWDGERLEI